MAGKVSIPIERDIDVATARLRAGALAEALGFSACEVFAVAIAVSEVARNIVRYARRGRIILEERREDGRVGLSVVAEDHGPGIPDLARAMEPGFSTGHSLGLGLNGAQRQMDEFEIVSARGKGTTVTMTKWHGNGRPDRRH